MRKTLAILAAIGSISVLTACGGSHGTSITTPSSLLGQWYQTQNGINGTYMTATVTSGHIQVNMKTRGSVSQIYWLGTFDTDKGTSKSFKTVSLGDPDAMAMSIFGSADKTKKFEYKNGLLSYKFSMLGSTTTVKLSKVPPMSITKTPTVKTTATKKPSPKATKTKTNTVKVPSAPRSTKK
jgi:hypothetical protein